MKLYIPPGYRPALPIKETEVAIKFIKDRFEDALARQLNLIRVSAPMFVFPESGLNDNLSGGERPVRFDVPDTGREVEVVHSLAKWKRQALQTYGFQLGEGLYTDMNAIRRDEDMDNTHSIYVDQWDWERVIAPQARNMDTLVDHVTRIFAVFKEVETAVTAQFNTPVFLPDAIKIMSTRELAAAFPGTPKEKETAACKKYGAVFLTQIGDTLETPNGPYKHDGRAPDYDDWTLNGDMLFYYPVLDAAFEVSSMGIRVDAPTLRAQAKLSACEDRLQMPYHQAVLDARLPYTIGGGLGQSRICMFMLGKAHIGEVQAALWPAAMETACQQAGIPLL